MTYYWKSWHCNNGFFGNLRHPTVDILNCYFKSGMFEDKPRRNYSIFNTNSELLIFSQWVSDAGQIQDVN